MIDKFRPRRGQIFIEINDSDRHTTPLGSNLIATNVFYTHTIPSGLSIYNYSIRPRRGQMYIELNVNRKYTTPLGSHLDYKQYFLYTFNPFGINKI